MWYRRRGHVTGWEKAIVTLARERAGELVKLAEELETNTSKPPKLRLIAD